MQRITSNKSIIDECKSATGNELELNDTINWFKNRENELKKYAGFIVENGLNTKNGMVLEIDKCKYNTIIPSLIDNNIEAVSLTRYEDINNEIPDYIRFYGVLKRNNGKVKLVTEHNELKIEDIGSLITQLPVCESTYESVMCSSVMVSQIFVGAYGKIYDKDYERKIKDLIDLKEYLNYLSGLNVESFFETDCDTYFGLVKSTQLKLNKK